MYILYLQSSYIVLRHSFHKLQDMRPLSALPEKLFHSRGKQWHAKPSDDSRRTNDSAKLGIRHGVRVPACIRSGAVLVQQGRVLGGLPNRSFRE